MPDKATLGEKEDHHKGESPRHKSECLSRLSNSSAPLSGPLFAPGLTNLMQPNGIVNVRMRSKTEKLAMKIEELQDTDKALLVDIIWQNWISRMRNWIKYGRKKRPSDGLLIKKAVSKRLRMRKSWRGIENDGCHEADQIHAPCL
jgi:hypothetical protein